MEASVGGASSIRVSPHTDTYANAYTSTHSRAHADTRADIDANAATDCHGNAGADHRADADAHSYARAGANRHLGARTDCCPRDGRAPGASSTGVERRRRAGMVDRPGGCRSSRSDWRRRGVCP